MSNVKTFRFQYETADGEQSWRDITVLDEPNCDVKEVAKRTLLADEGNVTITDIQ